MESCGWEFRSPFQWVDRQGQVVHLPSQCPSRVVSLFKKDYAITIQSRGSARACANQDQATCDSFTNNGAMFLPLMRLFNKLDKYRASILLKIVTNGIWTNTDFFNVGYSINPACPACGNAHDSVYHRCFSCPAIESRAKATVGISFFNDIIERGSLSLAGCRALGPCSPMVAKPSQCTLFGSIGMDVNQVLSPDNGPVYGDGSCFQSNLGPFSRSGWAFVQVDPAGNVLRAMYGCVPAAIPQTSLAGEHFAFWAAFENSLRCVYVGDCQHVLSAFRGGFASILASKSPHADLCKSAISRCESTSSRFVEVKKVKAHKSLDATIQAGESLSDYYGNFHADRLAKEGASFHTSVDQEVVSFKRLCKTVTELALHMIDCAEGLRADRVARFGKLERLPSGFTPLVNSNNANPHKFIWNGKMWCCTDCLLRTTSPPSLPPGRAVCRGVFPFASLLCGQNGHDLMVGRFADGARIVFCKKCWCYASAYARNLRKQCAGPGRVAPWAKCYLSSGQHPLSKLCFFRAVPLHSVVF